jgi:S-adenosylmethionine:tRNA ribosyltransferase-isomerase
VVVDALPARGDEVDEQREVVDPGVALGEQLLLEPFQPPVRLVEEPAQLGKAPADRNDLVAEPLAHGFVHPVGQPSLELFCRSSECLELPARAVERGLEALRVRASCTTLGDPPLRPLERLLIHEGQGYRCRRMKTSELDYDLPAELIAQRPFERRDASRLLVYRRATGEVWHRRFAELPEELDGELVVVNDTRVVPARLRLRRPGGGEAEVLLLERVDDGVWEALARPSRRLRAGQRLGPVELLEPLGEGRWRVRLVGEPDGAPPLPPYIHERLADPARYQTVYADEAGSAAAPTAGLHFTPGLLARLDVERVTLHVGLDTFRPLATDTLEAHRLHGERYHVAPAAWRRIAAAPRVLAVGTTTVRLLETVVRTGELAGRTTLFVTPPFEFRRVDALLTNFHLPRSTLLALVMAFAGVDETRELYRLAVAERYRFYSFGDAMLIL